MNDKIRNGNGHWRLDKRVSVGHLITTAAMIGACALWMLRLEGRINLVQVTEAGVRAQLEQANVTMTNRDNEIIRRLERIEDKVDLHGREGHVRDNP